MKVTMVVEDCMNVVGRGWVVIVYCDEFGYPEVHCGDGIVRGDITFTITGVERMSSVWWNKRIGLILSPNNLVPDHFEIGEELEILQKNV